MKTPIVVNVVIVACVTCVVVVVNVLHLVPNAVLVGYFAIVAIGRYLLFSIPMACSEDNMQNMKLTLFAILPFWSVAQVRVLWSTIEKKTHTQNEE